MSIKLTTVNDILLDVFPAAWKRITDCLKNEEKLDIGVFPPMECRKSTTSDKWAVELAKLGYNVLLAVPSGDVAQEHLGRIRKCGGDAHLLRSHKATFKGRELECPDYENIQYHYNLGTDSRYYKDMYCKNCPFYRECEYPKQYAEAVEPHNKIVIMQHAHFKCKETLWQLFQNKQFDVLIIDESFVDGLIDIIRPTDFEIEALKSIGTKWTLQLSSWLKDGGQPHGTIRMTPEELEALYKMFEHNNQPWRIKELIDAYNAGEWFHTKSGIKSFTPVPNIPVRVLTDATATLEELKIILNTSNIEVYGAGRVLDIREYHPENQVIQVIDSSLSKSSLMRDEKFYEFLNFIGDKCTHKFTHDKVLITAFKDKDDFAWTKETLDYLHEKFPHLDVGTDPAINRIVVDGMKVGVNTYAGFTVQFLMSSVYMSSYQIAEASYKIRMVSNYWRRKEGLDPLNNITPQADQGINMVPIPVRKIEPDGVFEYPDITLMVPEEKYARMAYDKNMGKSQQAIRIRFTANPEYRKVVYIFGNYNFPSLLVTKTVLFDDIVAELN